MQLLTIVKYDIKAGMIRISYKFAISIFVCLLSFWMFFKTVRSIPQGVTAYGYLGYLHCLFFVLPHLGVIMQFALALIIGDYTANDLAAYGQQILLRVKSRKLWYISKCIVLFLSVLLFYLCMLITVLASALFAEKTMLSEMPNVVMVFIKSIGTSVFLPFLLSLLLSFLQMFLGFILKPIYGFSLIIVLLAAYTYRISRYLFGEYYVFMAKGGNPYPYPTRILTALIISSCLLIGLFRMGLFIFNRYDIFHKES